MYVSDIKAQSQGIKQLRAEGRNTGLGYPENFHRESGILNITEIVGNGKDDVIMYLG